MYALLLIGHTRDGMEVRATLWASSRALALVKLPIFCEINGLMDWRVL